MKELIIINLSHVVCYKEIYSALPWGPYEPACHRAISFHRLDFFKFTYETLINIKIFKKRSNCGRLLPIRKKKLKRSNSNSLYKRQNADAYFFFILVALRCQCHYVTWCIFCQMGTKDTHCYITDGFYSWSPTSTYI